MAKGKEKRTKKKTNKTTRNVRGKESKSTLPTTIKPQLPKGGTTRGTIKIGRRDEMPVTMQRRRKEASTEERKRRPRGNAAFITREGTERELGASLVGTIRVGAGGGGAGGGRGGGAQGLWRGSGSGLLDNGQGRGRDRDEQTRSTTRRGQRAARDVRHGQSRGRGGGATMTETRGRGAGRPRVYANGKTRKNLRMDIGGRVGGGVGEVRGKGLATTGRVIQSGAPGRETHNRK